MIEIVLYRRANGEPERLTMTGHAGAGRHGQDIVCAAASALIETLMIGLVKVSGQSPEGTVDDGNADIRFGLPQSVESRAIIETICQGLEDLAQTEPKYVRFRLKESTGQQ